MLTTKDQCKPMQGTAAFMVLRYHKLME